MLMVGFGYFGDFSTFFYHAWYKFLRSDAKVYSFTVFYIDLQT